MSDEVQVATSSPLERLSGLATTVAGVIPLALAVVAEAAWIAIVANLLQVYALRPPVLDVATLAVLVVAGLVISRTVSLRLGGRWPTAALTISVIAALVGVFASTDAQLALAERGLDGVPDAVAANPGGLLAGMALLRGIGWGHAGLPLPEDRLIRLLTGGLIVITFAAIAGSLLVESWSGPFELEALGTGLAFGACSIVSLALTRQAIAAGDLAAAWRRNPTWVVALLLLVATSASMAMAAAGQLRAALEVLFGLAAIPIVSLGLIGGWTRRSFRVLFALLGGFVIVGALGSAMARRQEARPIVPNGVSAGDSTVDAAVATGVAGLIAVAVIVIVIVLVRLWMRQFRIDAENPIEERYVDRSDRTAPSRRRRLRSPFARQPVDAVGAYRALLTDLSERRGVRRDAWETPAEHAARLRSDERGGLPLDLLAADYALATFGGAELTPRENRRAIGRWRFLRRNLRERPAETADEHGSRLD